MKDDVAGHDENGEENLSKKISARKSLSLSLSGLKM
jgi:hypothetical protein